MGSIKPMNGLGPIEIPKEPSPIIAKGPDPLPWNYQFTVRVAFLNHPVYEKLHRFGRVSSVIQNYQDFSARSQFECESDAIEAAFSCLRSLEEDRNNAGPIFVVRHSYLMRKDGTIVQETAFARELVPDV